jgi:hypothetical protein
VSDIRDLVDRSSVGIRAQCEAGHPPIAPATGRLDLTAVRSAYAGSWVETLVLDAYRTGFLDGEDSDGETWDEEDV